MKTITRCFPVGITAWVLSTLISACGGGGGDSAAVFVPQFGVTERQLYDPTHRLDGIVVQTGSGAVSMQLESLGAEIPLPFMGDTRTAGADALYFNVVADGRVDLVLSEDDLQHVASLELFNAQQELLLKVDASSPQGSVGLLRGALTTPLPRFELRITSASGRVNNPQVIAWFGNILSSTANAAQLGQLSTNGPVQCDSCNLSGSLLGAYRLNGAYLSNANLRNTWLVKFNNDDLQLEDGQLFKLFMNASQIAGANLSGSNLSRADLTGAVLTGAGDARANLTGTNFNYAILNGLNLDGAAMTGAMLNHVQARQVSWVGADLTGAQMSSAQMSQGNFEGANLTGVNFSDADLRGSSFKGAQIDNVGVSWTRAQLTGAIWTDGRVCASESVGLCR